MTENTDTKKHKKDHLQDSDQNSDDKEHFTDDQLEKIGDLFPKEDPNDAYDDDDTGEFRLPPKEE